MKAVSEAPHVLFGIFAHPDDEAFGPSAYLYNIAQKGVDVHLILVTDGGAGNNPGFPNLAEVRHAEWLESGRRIGVKSNFALGYADGTLCNNQYLEIANKIITHINIIIDNYEKDVLIDFMTFEQRGITGHLDHIAVSFITTYIYEHLRNNTSLHTGSLRYYCLPKSMAPECKCDWIYMPEGRMPSEIDEVISYKEIVDHKLHIMRAHESQKQDMESILISHENNGASEDDCVADHFILYK